MTRGGRAPTPVAAASPRLRWRLSRQLVTHSEPDARRCRSWQSYWLALASLRLALECCLRPILALALELLREVLGQPAPEFFVDVIENGRGIGLLLERLGRSDSAFFSRMTSRK